jgi:hypothetical protein
MTDGNVLRRSADLHGREMDNGPVTRGGAADVLDDVREVQSASPAVVDHARDTSDNTKRSSTTSSTEDGAATELTAADAAPSTDGTQEQERANLKLMERGK